jgi:glucokinase
MSYAIGIDFGGTNIKVVAVDAAGRAVEPHVRKTPDRAGTMPDWIDAIRATITEFEQSQKRPADFVGMAFPGLAAEDGSSIVWCPEEKLLGLQDLNWSGVLGRKVPVLNDAHAALLGETWCGAATGCRNAVLLTLGTGVGGAILSDGRLLKGALGRAGHLGHISISDDEERSIAGTPGALELAVGDYTVVRRSGGRFSSTEELLKAHLSGDAAASEIWLKSVRALARGITSFINMLDPEVIIIGGGIARAGEALFEPLSVALAEIEWCPTGERVRIIPAQLGEWAGAYGAAWNALNS